MGKSDLNRRTFIGALIASTWPAKSVASLAAPNLLISQTFRVEPVPSLQQIKEAITPTRSEVLWMDQPKTYPLHPEQEAWLVFHIQPVSGSLPIES